MATKKKPRNESLPGMEDRSIKELKTCALDYADVRDERMQLSKREVDLKAKLLDLMKSQKRETYSCEGVEITIVHEAESVKVKVAKKDEDDPDVD